MTASVKPPLALLIDGENVTHQIAPALLLKASGLGDPIVGRVYGRPQAPATVAWQNCSGVHALTLHAPNGAVAGKNAADIAMVIGAIDLLHNTPIRHFCLVSSDSDFSGLALYLCKAGCTVYGVGRANSPAALRNAYRRFITIESLSPAPKLKTAPAQKPKPVNTVVPLIERAIAEAPDPRVPTSLSFVGARLHAYLPDFDPRAWGHRTVSRLVNATGRYHVTKSNGMMYIAPKPVAGDTRH